MIRAVVLAVWLACFSSGIPCAERLCYGAKSIQELVTDPVINRAGALASGDPELVAAASDEGEGGGAGGGDGAGKGGGGGDDGDGGGESWAEASDPQTSTLALEEAQVNAAGGGGGATTTTRLEREYVWGPGDLRCYELLVQYDVNRSPWWMLADGGGDLVMMARAGGSNGTATCAAQWTYDAYGSVIAENVFAVSPAPPVNRCGHKGLVVDRLDGAIVTSESGPDSKRLVPGARLQYFVNNRSLSPELGRFLQSDPNATGTVVVSESYHGSVETPGPISVDLAQHYRDGANTFAYLRTAPYIGDDPLGLFVDSGDLVMVGVGALRGGLEEMLGQYAANMEADVEWAMDWDMEDDWHTRGDDRWVMESFARGLIGGTLEQLDPTGLSGDLLLADRARGLGTTAKVGSRAIRSIRDMNRLEVYESYEIAKHAADKLPTEHSHKLVELQMIRPLRGKGEVLQGTGPAINIDGTVHLSTIRRGVQRGLQGTGRHQYGANNRRSGQARCKAGLQGRAKAQERRLEVPARHVRFTTWRPFIG